MTCRHCPERSDKEIRGIWLCNTHYVEAIEHSADMSFDANKFAAMAREAQYFRKLRVMYADTPRNAPRMWHPKDATRFYRKTNRRVK